MTSIAEEYSTLIRKNALLNKYTLKALQIVAETNDHHAKEILKATEQAYHESSDQNREALASLLKILSTHPAYRVTEEKEVLKRSPVQGDKKRKIQKKETLFLPYPPEYLLFSLIDKKTYTESYTYYSTGDGPNANSALEPQLTREYLVTPNLAQAQKLLYSTIAQCKVCGLRFDTLEKYAIHGEAHQRKSQMNRSITGTMYRPWLLEPMQWTEQQPTMNLKFTAQGAPMTVPVHGDRSQKCTICKDGFEIIWSDEDECWSFKDAILLRSSPTRQICHQRCAT